MGGSAATATHGFAPGVKICEGSHVQYPFEKSMPELAEVQGSPFLRDDTCNNDMVTRLVPEEPVDLAGPAASVELPR